MGKRDLVQTVSRDLWHRGLFSILWGNLSVRDVDDGNRIWVSPSGPHKRKLSRDDLVAVNLDGQPDDPAARPSSERLLHCEIYRRRADVTAIVHSHGNWSNLLAGLGLRVEPVNTEAAWLGDIPVVPYRSPGSPTLATDAADALGDGHAVFLQNHGMAIATNDLVLAAGLSLQLENACRMIVTARQMQMDLALIDEAETERIRSRPTPYA